MYVLRFFNLRGQRSQSPCLLRDLGDCRDNLRNSRSVFLIVFYYSKTRKLMQKKASAAERELQGNRFEGVPGYERKSVTQ